METYGENILDQRIVEKTLISLPEKFDPIISVIEETKEIDKLSIQELMGSIKTLEQRLSRHSKKSIESVFQSKLNVNSKIQERDSFKSDSSGGVRHGRGRATNGRRRGMSNFERWKCGVHSTKM